jgi:ankyrin repeat protein
VKLTIVLAATLLGGLMLRAETGLFEALRNGDVATIRTLVRSSADLNSRNYIGATPLMYAAAFASQECIRLLLDSGADVNATSKAGATALMWATGDTAKVRLLLERDAKVNMKAKDGTTALVSAAFRENVDAMRLLMARGADAKGSADALCDPRTGVRTRTCGSFWPKPALSSIECQHAVR